VIRFLRPASLATMDEPSVVAMASAGEEAAFAELMRRRQAVTRNLLARLCRNPALADDLAQEAFLQAWRQLPTLRSHDAFGGWLRQIAVNAWLQHRRRRGEAALEDVEAPEPASEPTLGERMDLLAALQTLAPAARLCVVLAHSEGMSHGEIADATGLPLGTVKTHVNRGSARLRELLAAYRQPEKPAS
jgi:RNA polymerase sigma-70 factor (ECF subfamily)